MVLDNAAVTALADEGKIDLDKAVERYAVIVPELQEAAVFYFVGYELQGDSVALHFLCPEPGAGMEAQHTLTAPVADIEMLADAKAFEAFAIAAVTAQLRPQRSDIGLKLDGFLKTALTV